MQWVDLVLHISIYPGNQGRVISCSVDSASWDVIGFRPLFIELVLSLSSGFSLCTPTSAFKVADFIFLLWFFWCSIQRLPTLVASALFFLLRASKTCHLSKEVIAPICSDDNKQGSQRGEANRGSQVGAGVQEPVWQGMGFLTSEQMDTALLSSGPSWGIHF